VLAKRGLAAPGGLENAQCAFDELEDLTVSDR
jgi:hypothetical protein